MSQFFAEYARLVVFFHVIFAIIWIGGMIVVRFAVHQGLGGIEDKGVRLGTTIKILDRFFKMIIGALTIMAVTGFIMLKASSFPPAMAVLAHVKTQIWTVMTVVFGYIYYRFAKAKDSYASGDLAMTTAFLAPIPKYLILVNISLGLLAVLFGVILRGY